MQEADLLIDQNHSKKVKIRSIIENLNQDWAQLANLVKLKSEKLSQSESKNALLKMSNDIHIRLDEIEKQLNLNLQGIKLNFFLFLYKYFFFSK